MNSFKIDWATWQNLKADKEQLAAKCEKLDSSLQEVSKIIKKLEESTKCDTCKNTYEVLRKYLTLV